MTSRETSPNYLSLFFVFSTYYYTTAYCATSAIYSQSQKSLVPIDTLYTSLWLTVGEKKREEASVWKVLFHCQKKASFDGNGLSRPHRAIMDPHKLAKVSFYYYYYYYSLSLKEINVFLCFFLWRFFFNISCLDCCLNQCKKAFTKQKEMNIVWYRFCAFFFNVRHGSTALPDDLGNKGVKINLFLFSPPLNMQRQELPQ